MKQIKVIDDAFLRLESRRIPLHIGGLMVLKPEQDPHEVVMALAEKMRQYTQPAVPYNRRVVTRRGKHFWKETSDFDITQHFIHVALPKPGRYRELFSMVSRLHSGHLDRAFPLWTFYLIEGLQDGCFAVYFKIHHSVMDGISMITSAIHSMSNDREKSKSIPPMWAMPSSSEMKQPQPVPVRRGGLRRIVRSFAREPIGSVKPVLREFRSNITDMVKKNPDFVAGGHGPRCVINQSVSASRRFAAQSLSATRIRSVARACDGTSNDVILAICGGALRQYLIELNDLPQLPLVAGVPVSIRRDNTSLGNEVAFTFAHLATDIEDPLQRFKAIKACMDYNKQHLKQLSPDQTIISAALKLLVPTIYYALTERDEDLTLGNICISHIPGPRETLYWQGAKLCGLYPASVLIDGSAINITVVSRHDYVDFGLVACPKAMPKVQRILTLMEQALNELEQCVSVALPHYEPVNQQVAVGGGFRTELNAD